MSLIFRNRNFISSSEQKRYAPCLRAVISVIGLEVGHFANDESGGEAINFNELTQELIATK